MKPITFDETLALADYDRVRERLRPIFMHEKERRRLEVGSHLSFLFENPQTVWYQVQEMIRTERMTERGAIQHELDTYNELLPGAAALSATMFIQYPETAERDGALRRLLGLERHLWIVIGDRRERAIFDTRQMNEARISSVQFVRFPVAGIAAEQFLEFARAGKCALESDHPSLAARAVITAQLAVALAEDLV
ncbi:MAG TPA: DUF3501 family protein [Candidatus Binataceae bacterium]|nr:DUF3501 family protein [Candidatus Binataceae bacterium]